MTADHRFGEFLAESFATLRRELPDIYAQMCRQLAPREIVIETGDELVAICFDRDAAWMPERSQCPAIRVRTSRPTILALLDAKRTLLQAVLNDDLILSGSLQDLLVFHDGLTTYIHGAVRAPSFPKLLRAYRSIEPDTRPSREGI